MATFALSRPRGDQATHSPLARWRDNLPLAFVGGVMIVAFVGTIVGLIVDPRAISGEPAWLKPMKFAISIAIYSFTLLWLLTFIDGRRWLVAAISWITAAVFLIEEGIIGLQAARGVRSHFNEGTPFDANLWRAMGIAIVIFWLANLVVAGLLLRQRFTNPVLAWSLRFGLIIALVGMAVAFFMPQPSPAQEAQLAATGTSRYVGAHSVGVEDGGPGLPIVGWSTEGGDLRVAHFFGIHALQAMPLIGWLLIRTSAGWLTVSDRVRLVILAGIGGLGLVVLLTWQALRAQPLIAPDALTFGVLFGGLALLAVAAAIIVVSARQRVLEVAS